MVTPFGQAMAAPMVSGNPFLVRLVSFLSLISTHVFFFILPLTSSSFLSAAGRRSASTVSSRRLLHQPLPIGRHPISCSAGSTTKCHSCTYRSVSFHQVALRRKDKQRKVKLTRLTDVGGASVEPVSWPTERHVIKLAELFNLLRRARGAAVDAAVPSSFLRI